MAEVFYVSRKKYEELLEELKNLKEIKQQLSQEIGTAAAQGDLKENAEYHAAREKQGQVEARIKELEYLLENATVIEEGSSSVVSVGSTVEIKYVDDDEIEEYLIVGSTEVDPFNNKISNESPIAKGIMGRKVNDKVTIESPNGNYDIEIVSIK